MDKFLNFKKVDEKNTELFVYGDIRKKSWIDRWLEMDGMTTDATDAFSLKDALAVVDTPNLTVRINSYGGSVSEGLAIYNLLSDFKGNLTTVVDGFACSAASVIFMAGRQRVVPESGLLMIHNASNYAIGDSNVMEKMAEDLRQQTQPSINIYVSKTGLSEEKIKEMMDRQTWITSKEAFEMGFATNLEKNDEAKQSLESNYVYDLVVKLKDFESKLSQLKNVEVEKPEKQGAWASFFNI